MERLEISSRAEWRRWLVRHHGRAESIWVVTYRKTQGVKHVSYDEVVEEALCFGWIDSLPRKLSETQTMLLVSPRRRKSPWSALNKKRIVGLIKSGLMTPAGQAKIDAAKADGSWSALDEADSLVIPADLKRALGEAGTEALGNFQAFSPSSRRAILWWITSAKRPETRSRRVFETARLAQMNVKANHPTAGRKRS